MSTKLISENDTLPQNVIQWACESLISLQYTLNDKVPETILNTP
jgi:hypothetical protein